VSEPVGVSHVAVVTGDFDGFRAFYEETIGLETIMVLGAGPGHAHGGRDGGWTSTSEPCSGWFARTSSRIVFADHRSCSPVFSLISRGCRGVGAVDPDGCAVKVGPEEYRTLTKLSACPMFMRRSPARRLVAPGHPNVRSRPAGWLLFNCA
jgi:catechol 2,3-dioxygenase-like lactoylglutathione lyase family enzyme